MNFLFCSTPLPNVLLNSVFFKKVICKSSLHITGTSNLLIWHIAKIFIQPVICLLTLLVQFVIENESSILMSDSSRFSLWLVRTPLFPPVYSWSQPCDDGWDSHVPAGLSWLCGHKQLGHRWASGPTGPVIPLLREAKWGLSANQSVSFQVAVKFGSCWWLFSTGWHQNVIGMWREAEVGQDRRASQISFPFSGSWVPAP